MARNKIYLVPGFFGFVSLGSLNYFHRVGERLQRELQRRGIEADIVEAQTQPTGSIRRRADRLLQFVLDTGGQDADTLHFVGHSTGGLDIRLLCTPGVRLRPDDSEVRIGERVRSVVTVATPHFGTPLANHLTGLQGRRLLELLTVMATHGLGRHSMILVSRLLSRLASLDDLLGRRETFLDTFARRLLDQLTVDPEHPLWSFLRDVSADQGAIIQLTPEGMNLFNAAVVDRAEVMYASVVTAAPAPLAHPFSRLLHPGRAATILLFSLLHWLTAQEHAHYPYPSRAHAEASSIQSLLPFPLDPGTSDGVVPTLSQVYGEVVDAVVADHLDVVGQFSWAGGQRFMDWLPSGSNFDEDRFRRVWAAVAEVISRAVG